MADFCKQCSIANFGEDFGDLKGLCPEEGLLHTICEGCGYVYVNSEGACITNCLKSHGTYETKTRKSSGD